MDWISPTESFDIRNDPAGLGNFGSPRGGHTHNGIDLVIYHGQTIVCPCDCQYIRISNPYRNDNRWHGVLLRKPPYDIFLWYLRPYYFRKGAEIEQGEMIGIAQDIVEKYGPPMTPHIHLGIKEYGKWIDPMGLIK